MAVYAAPRSTPAYITAVEEAYYLSNPLKAPGGRRVRLGQTSDATAPAPGSDRPTKPASINFIPPTALAPGILDTLVRQLLSADEMAFLHSKPSGVELPGDFREGDWGGLHCAREKLTRPQSAYATRTTFASRTAV